MYRFIRDRCQKEKVDPPSGIGGSIWVFQRPFFLLPFLLLKHLNSEFDLSYIVQNSQRKLGHYRRNKIDREVTRRMQQISPLMLLSHVSKTLMPSLRREKCSTKRSMALNSVLWVGRSLPSSSSMCNYQVFFINKICVISFLCTGATSNYGDNSATTS